MQDSDKSAFGTKKVKILNKLSSNQVVDQNLEYVDARRKGRIKSLETKFPTLNKYLMGGVELDTILCISALSGAGKSTLSKCIRDSLYDLNKDMEFNQYIFNFEMVAQQQIGRSIVSKADIGLQDLYSIETPLTDDQYKQLQEYYDELRDRDVWFIETPDTAEAIANSLISYWVKECKPYGKTLVYEIDHALLTKGEKRQDEKERIDDLMYRLVEVKKYIYANGGHSIGIVLSQMNREIRKIDRITNKELHRPDTSCLYGASSIEQCSDYILFSHIPAKLNIKEYTQAKYPTVVNVDGIPVQMAYFELVKQRSGIADVTIPLWNKLHRFDFDEMDINLFKNLHHQFKESKECSIQSNAKLNI